NKAHATHIGREIEYITRSAAGRATCRSIPQIEDKVLCIRKKLIPFTGGLQVHRSNPLESQLQQALDQPSADKAASASDDRKLAGFDFLDHGIRAFDSGSGRGRRRLDARPRALAEINEVYLFSEIRLRQHSPAVDDNQSAFRTAERLSGDSFECRPSRGNDQNIDGLHAVFSIGNDLNLAIQY